MSQVFSFLTTSVTRKPCYRKDDRAMHPIYKQFTLILFTLTATILCTDFDCERIYLRKFCLFLQEWRFGRSRSSEVIDFGANRKRVCDFLLVRNNNLAAIMHHFGDMTAFMCSWPHLYSAVILGCSRPTSRCTRSPMLGHLGSASAHKP